MNLFMALHFGFVYPLKPSQSYGKGKEKANSQKQTTYLQ